MNVIRKNIFLLGMGVFLLIGIFSGAYSEETKTSGVQTDSADSSPSGGVKLHKTFDAISTSTRFQYRSEGRRDPFLSFVRPAGERAEGVPPLQSVSISELKLIGVASGARRKNISCYHWDACWRQSWACKAD